MTDREFLLDLQARLGIQLVAPVEPPPPPVEPPPPPPPAPTPPGVPPPYHGAINWDLGLPGEVSPTTSRRHAAAGVQYAIRFTKTSDGNTLRLQGVPWFTHVLSSIPGVRGEYRGMQSGGYSDIPIAGAPNSSLVVLFTLEATVPSGDIAPQLF